MSKKPKKQRRKPYVWVLEIKDDNGHWIPLFAEVRREDIKAIPCERIRRYTRAGR